MSVDTSTDRVLNWARFVVEENLKSTATAELVRALVEERDSLRAQLTTERRLRIEDAAGHIDDQGVTAKAMKVLREERDTLTAKVKELEAELELPHAFRALQDAAALASPAQEPTP